MKTICIIIPAYNEEKNVSALYTEIKKVVAPLEDRYQFELVYVNDGSRDGTAQEIENIIKNDSAVRLIDFSRNFGKEIATTAGINHCTADACIMIDADLQHPVDLIPRFIAKWEEGNDVVVGIRRKTKSDGYLKRMGSAAFYRIINWISDIEIIPNATDFRLIDRKVVVEFNKFTETSRMTRALIDWLGFRRAYITFDAHDRLNGTASYSTWKLIKLAINSFVSLSLFPLKLAGYLGIVITLISGPLGFLILIGKYFIKNEIFIAKFSDAESLAILIIFLVGIILMSIGLIALYIANIHAEVIKRPMYVIRNK